MKEHYRTTLDGINYILLPAPTPKPTPRPPAPKPPRPLTPAEAAPKFNLLRLVIDDAQFLTPQDLTD